MGWWGFEPLAGDLPLDLLSYLPDALGLDSDPDLSDGLYPDGTLPDDVRPQVAARLNGTDAAGGDAIIAAMFAGEDQEWVAREGDPVAWQILAVVWMASGAPMGDDVKVRARQAVTDDPWRKNEEAAGVSGGRQAALDQFVAAVDRYSGTPTAVRARTLGEAFDAAADAGHSGIINVGPEVR